MQKRIRSKKYLAAAIAFALALAAIAGAIAPSTDHEPSSQDLQAAGQSAQSDATTVVGDDENAQSAATATADETAGGNNGEERLLEGEIPAYDGTAAYVQVDGGVPGFTDTDLASTASWESYSPLDELGRVGVAEACLGLETMPTEEREDIGDVVPSGWDQGEYGFVDGGWLYNRYHLIGFQLAGENANERNLMTGTRSMNLTMLDFENRVADYVRTVGNHVLYRVTPVFEGDDLVASGVQMEAMSVEDRGRGISLNVYVFNVEPGIGIDYATGANWADGTVASSPSESAQEAEKAEYVLNVGSMKIHRPDCPSVGKMSQKNRKDVTATLDDLLAQGYTTCANCF